MGGPIVRTGTTPAFWENWDKAFGGKKGSAASKSTASKSAAKKPAKAVKSAKPKVARKATRKKK